MKPWRLLGLSAILLAVDKGGCQPAAALSIAPPAKSAQVMKVICLGDSITGQSNLEKYLKWSHVLDCMLEARLGPGRTCVLNRGIGGNSTGDVLKRLDKDVLAEKPDLVILLIGGNDAAHKGNQEKTRANLTKIVADIRGTGARLLMLQYHVLVNPASPDTAWRHLEANNGLIAEVATAAAIPVLDMGAEMKKALATYRVTELVNERDGVHLNSAGELVFARAVFAKLRALGWVE